MCSFLAHVAGSGRARFGRNCRVMAKPKKTKQAPQSQGDGVKRGAKGLRRSVPRPRPTLLGVQITARLPEELVERIDALADRYAAHGVTRAGIVRQCCERALDDVAKMYSALTTSG